MDEESMSIGYVDNELIPGRDTIQVSIPKWGFPFKKTKTFLVFTKLTKLQFDRSVSIYTHEADYYKHDAFAYFAATITGYLTLLQLLVINQVDFALMAIVITCFFMILGLHSTEKMSQAYRKIDTLFKFSITNEEYCK
jgi:hypothetical protein